jgi:hypothetical protein
MHPGDQSQARPKLLTWSDLPASPEIQEEPHCPNRVQVPVYGQSGLQCRETNLKRCLQRPGEKGPAVSDPETRHGNPAGRMDHAMAPLGGASRRLIALLVSELISEGVPD